jgi:hypothetical protein
VTVPKRDGRRSPRNRNPREAEAGSFSVSAFPAGPTFFVSAWLLMIFAGIVGADVGIRPFGYLTAMVVTIGLWLVLAPTTGAIARTGKSGKKS